MRRWTLRVLCWLALGAVVNVAVAWAGACLFEPSRDVTSQFFRGDDLENPLSWPLPRYGSLEFQHPNTVAQMRRFIRGDIEAGAHSVRVPAFDEATGLAREVPTSPNYFLMDVQSFGFPCLALRGVRSGYFLESTRAPESVQTVGWLAVPRWIVRSSIPDPGVPYLVLPMGFAVNTGVYAAVLAVLSLSAEVRRWHRRRHHLCIRCACPVADPAKPCSECGRLPTTR